MFELLGGNSIGRFGVEGAVPRGEGAMPEVEIDLDMGGVAVSTDFALPDISWVVTDRLIEIDVVLGFGLGLD